MVEQLQSLRTLKQATLEAPLGYNIFGWYLE